MTDEPKYMHAINTVRLHHSKHERSQRCKRKRKDGRWYIQAKKIGYRVIGVCSVCGETVENYYV